MAAARVQADVPSAHPPRGRHNKTGSAPLEPLSGQETSPSPQRSLRRSASAELRMPSEGCDRSLTTAPIAEAVFKFVEIVSTNVGGSL